MRHRARKPVPTSPLHALVAAVPLEALRQLVLTLLLQSGPAPAVSAPAIAEPAPRIHRGWPRGVPRGPRKPAAGGRSRAQLDKINARRKAARAAARVAKQPNGGGNGSTAGIEPTAAQVWQHAEKLQPKAPWRAIVREFGINEALAQDAHRTQKLPPGVGPEAAARFLEMAAD
jgi:hypothetical protein